MSDATVLLNQWQAGDQDALGRLSALLYTELRSRAQGVLQRHGAQQALQPTELVNECYLKLAASGNVPDWHNRAHFLAVSARVMRQVLIDEWRTGTAVKRSAEEITLHSGHLLLDDATNLQDLEQALVRLDDLMPHLADVVTLRFFGGLTLGEIAASTQRSEATVKRQLQAARAWLLDTLGPADG